MYRIHARICKPRSFAKVGQMKFNQRLVAFRFMLHYPVVGRKLGVVYDGSFKDANGVSLKAAHWSKYVKKLYSFIFSFSMFSQLT